MSLIDWRTLIPTIEGHSKDECEATVEENFNNRKVMLEQGLPTAFKSRKNIVFKLTFKGTWNAVAWYAANNITRDSLTNDRARIRYDLFHKARHNQLHRKNTPIKILEEYGTIKDYLQILPKPTKRDLNT